MKEKTAFKMQHILSDQLNLGTEIYDLQDFSEDFELTFPICMYLSHVSALAKTLIFFYVWKISLIYSPHYV